MSGDNSSKPSTSSIPETKRKDDPYGIKQQDKVVREAAKDDPGGKRMPPNEGFGPKPGSQQGEVSVPREQTQTAHLEQLTPQAKDKIQAAQGDPNQVKNLQEHIRDIVRSYQSEQLTPQAKDKIQAAQGDPNQVKNLQEHIRDITRKIDIEKNSKF